MRRFTVIQFTIVIGFVVTIGCGPNHRYFYCGNVKLAAQLKNGDAKYESIEIGTPTSPFDDRITEYGNVKVEITKGDLVPLKDLTVEALENASLATKSLDSVGYGTGWPKGSKRLTLGSHLFAIVNDNRILKLYAYSDGLDKNANQPRFGKVGLERLIAMPLNQDDAVYLFGTPEKLDDIRHN